MVQSVFPLELSSSLLSWQRLSELVREARRNGDANVTQREIDLAYGLKDGQVSNFTHFIQLFYIILM
jgi:hypothetical protein